MPSAGPIFYSAPDGYERLYATYFRIARGFPGWDITNIKALPVREREFWLAVLDFQREMQQWHQMTQPPQVVGPSRR